MNRFNSTLRPSTKGMKRSQLRRRRALVASKKSLRAKRKTEPGSEARIKQDLTRLFSLRIRLRDPRCIVCGKPSTDASHLWHRDMPATEFDPENVWGCCHPCNMAHETRPQAMRDAVFLRLGERGYADLADRAHSSRKLGYVELVDLFEATKAELKDAA